MGTATPDVAKFPCTTSGPFAAQSLKPIVGFQGIYTPGIVATNVSVLIPTIFIGLYKFLCICR